MKLFGRKEQKTFEKEFRVVGKMTCVATDESRCRDWKRNMDYMGWKDVELCFGDPVGNEDDLEMMVHQYELAISNEKEIEAQLLTDHRVSYLTKEGEPPLDKDAKVQMCLHAKDYDGNIHPYVELSYETGDKYIWIAIEDGKFFVFTDGKV